MEPVTFNDRGWKAIVTETRTGFFVKAAGIFDLPAGYRVLMEWRFKRWPLTVSRCVRCPSGEQETWLWMIHVQERQDAMA